MNISMQTYVALSIVMFLEYAVWGAWAPVLAARLLGPLKMTGKQTGLIYSTLPIACIFAPFLSGWVADRFVNAEWVLIAAHAIGAVLLFIAAKQEKFSSLWIVMFCYSLCYASTLPLVNSVLFAVKPNGVTSANVFLWAPVAWALVGWSLTGWRMTRKEAGDGSDCLYLAAFLSLLMALGCVYVHQISPTKPPGSGFPLQGVIDTLGNTNFLIFVLVSMVIAGLMQFYFLGSAQFMQDAGISSKAVPGAMALAQIAQALATYFLLGWVLVNLGFKWPLIIGASCWFVLYLAYIAGRPQWLIVVSQPLHGFAYVFFMIVGQVVTNEVSADEIISSMQALIFAATTGVGLFAGTNFAGAVMDSSSRDGKFQWPKIWAVPALVTLTGVVVLLFAFSEPPKKADPPAKPAVSWNTPGR